MATIVKKILLILLPLIVMLAVYLAFDPFEVVYRYKSHYNDPRINYNWDYNQTETLIRNYADRKYDSFIFGSSRSIAFLTEDWSRFIGSSRTLHFAAMNESLYGVHRKVLFLSKERMPIRNALVILDTQLMSMYANSTGHLFIKHPEVSGESPLTFHLTFFRAFMDIPYFIGYLDYKLTGKVRPVFQKKFGESLRYDPVTGDKIQDKLEKSIAENSEKYYKERSSVFYPRDVSKPVHAAPVLQDIQVGMLREMRKVFDDNRTDYRIVISPNYDQKYLSRVDLARLQEIFGADRVYDYSGINRFTRDIHNYYEDSHYRPLVARQILAEIYGGQGGGGDGR
jgi:hypothetical protein